MHLSKQSKWDQGYCLHMLPQAPPSSQNVHKGIGALPMITSHALVGHQTWQFLSLVFESRTLSTGNRFPICCEASVSFACRLMQLENGGLIASAAYPLVQYFTNEACFCFSAAAHQILTSLGDNFRLLYTSTISAHASASFRFPLASVNLLRDFKDFSSSSHISLAASPRLWKLSSASWRPLGF